MHDEELSTRLRHSVPADAHADFERLAPGHELEMLDELAEVWERHRRPLDAIAVLRELLRRYPTHARACRWQAGVVGQYHALLDGPRALEETERLVRVLARTPRRDDCHVRVHDLTLTQARRISRHALDADQIFLAERLYELFLHAFPDDAEVTAVRRERLLLRHGASRIMRR